MQEIITYVCMFICILVCTYVCMNEYLKCRIYKLIHECTVNYNINSNKSVKLFKILLLILINYCSFTVANYGIKLIVILSVKIENALHALVRN